MDIDGNVVVIGGGTGSFSILSALKSRARHITAIVNMADDGGSTGVLRDELGALPPGDIRQCLVALSDVPAMRDLFNYRFEEGTFGGHSFGNIFLTALEKTTGDFAAAIEEASRILRVNGSVVPATLDNVRLVMSWPDGQTSTLHGEHVIDAKHFEHDPREAELRLEPTPKVNPHAIAAIEQADLVIIAPGDVYTSLGPLLVIDGIGQALERTSAQVVYICNLVTKLGQTDGFSVEDHKNEIERFAGRSIIDTVVYNTEEPLNELARRYESEQAFTVKRATDMEGPEWFSAGLLGGVTEHAVSDVLPVTRSYIRHDSAAVLDAIIKVYNNKL